jgi:hypothetical protein
LGFPAASNASAPRSTVEQLQRSAWLVSPAGHQDSMDTSFVLKLFSGFLAV